MGRIKREHRNPWPLQTEAIRDVIRGLSHRRRGKLVMACGLEKPSPP